ncbi:MAG: hypothetical protein ACLVB1_06855 [Blautia obeum]
MHRRKTMAGMFLGFIVLEWSSGDRWPADPAGLCCFSDGKLDYLILAATSVIFRYQTRIFAWGKQSLLFTGD